MRNAAPALFAIILAGAARAEGELSGTIKLAPARVGLTRLEGVSPALERVLARAAEAKATVTVRASWPGDDDPGLPLIMPTPMGVAPSPPPPPPRARFIAARGHVVADTRVLGRDGSAREEVRANQPVWVVAARDGADPLVELELAPGGERRLLAASLVRVGGDATGELLGELLAPAFKQTSAARKARTFHPDGSVWAAEVVSLAPSAPWREAAARFEGAAIVRMGAGLFKHGQLESLPDLLSLAIRFKARPAPGQPLVHAAAPGDQDLFVTAETDRFSDFFNPLVPLAFAEEHEYFANTYHPAQKFLLEGTGQRVWVRLVPVSLRELGPGDERTPAAREARLRKAVADGAARFRLEVQEEASALRRWTGLTIGFTKDFWAKPWTPLAELRLVRPLNLDQEAMRYHPDLAGRGLVPVGVVPSIRPAVYRASQDGRPASESERDTPKNGITGVVEMVEPGRN